MNGGQSTLAPPARVDLVTLGESMVLFQPLRDGPLAHETLLTRSVGGAESNVAIALARLGQTTRWVSRLGRDPFGDIIETTLRGQGVDTSFVTRDETAATAVFFREIKAYGDPNVYYFRRDSAASRLSTSDIKREWLQDARHLHVTGITPALSQSACEATIAAMKMAREMGLSISFDPNLRRKLWDGERARQTLLSLVPLCDIFLPGIDEATFLCGETDVAACLKYFEARGPSLVVIKQGEQGATAWMKAEQISAPAYPIERVMDSVGAGDAFAAGFLSVLLEEESVLKVSSKVLYCALKRANFLGAIATQFRGDWEGLPSSSEVQKWEAGEDFIAR